MVDRPRSRRVRRGTVAGALILIVVGFILLLNNLGYLPGDIWQILWRFWPVILILLGADIALRGFPAWFALPVLVLVVVAVVGAVLLIAPTLPAAPLGETVTESLSQDLGDLSQAHVRLEMDKGTLRVQQLDDQSDQLMEGQFSHASNLVIQQGFGESSGRGRLSLADRYDSFFPFIFLTGMRNEWSVGLFPLIPLELELEADDSQLNLELNNLNLASLTAQLEDCRGKISLPSSSDLNANLDLDGGDLTLSLPTDARTRIALNFDDTGLIFDSSRFTKTGDNEYVSREYGAAEIKLDLTIRATDASVTIE